jgi:CheY-like chemotaxis protein
MTGAHALVIDDNELNIDVLTMLLANEGLSFTAIQFPRELPAVLESLETIDIVFLDLEFPAGDGFQILSELRTNPDLENVPIVAYTVHTSEIDTARRAGFNSFIGKPLDAKRFPHQLKRILNRQPVWEV